MNKGLKVGLVICIILVLVLGGYIVYDKVLNKETKKGIVESETKKEVNNTATVSDIINYDFTMDDMKTKRPIVAPQINKKSDVVAKLNKTMLEDTIKYSFLMMDLLDSSRYASITSKYNFTIKNNIVAIYENIKYSEWPSSGNGNFSFNYFYDDTNDKVLNFVDGIKALGVTLDELKVAGANSFSELTNLGMCDQLFLEIDDNNNYKVVFYNAPDDEGGC